jgi:hypothetical protein
MRGGKENDLRIELKHILYVELADCNLGFEIPPSQYWFTDEDWKKRYPKAHAIYRIVGESPSSYVTKNKI